jgi:ribosomal protein L12E/L44/L45/RPP1/RPP2
MEYMYAILMLHETGKEITKETITAILKSIQLEPDENTLSILIETLPTMDLTELLRAQCSIVSRPEVAKPEKTPQTEDQPKPAEESVGLSKLFG